MSEKSAETEISDLSHIPGTDPVFLAATSFLDFDHPAVRQKALEVCSKAATEQDKAVKLFLFVRDQVLYDVRMAPAEAAFFKASSTLTRGFGFCVPKAILLSALARAAGIPSRLHVSDIINHRTPAWLVDAMGTNLFVFHTYSELWLDGRWVKATPAIDRGLADRHQWILVDFDGQKDALFNRTDRQGRLHIEYTADWGVFADFPFELFKARFEEAYGELIRLSTADMDPEALEL